VEKQTGHLERKLDMRKVKLSWTNGGGKGAESTRKNKDWAAPQEKLNKHVKGRFKINISGIKGRFRGGGERRKVPWIKQN